MIIMLEPDASEQVIKHVEDVACSYPEITVRRHTTSGAELTVTEIYLLGPTKGVPTEVFEGLTGVKSVTRISTKYKLIGRHHDEHGASGFEYNGVKFDESELLLFAGLCAVDTPEHVEKTMAALKERGLVTTRMGAYKPRTSPYDFQGHGAKCLPYVFELAGKYGIKVISMEVTSPKHIDEICLALDQAGQPTGVMLQIGTRNAQNFELLKEVGQQGELPVLFKRGMGITLEESLNAAEYIASEGNPRIVFCLRGVKSHLGDPHRNLVDFGAVPIVRRLTRLPVCVDPSHSVGRPFKDPEGVPDVLHVMGQGILSGATMALVDLHPRPEVALCDGPQALTLDMLPWLEEHGQIARRAYEQMRELAQKQPQREA